MHLSFFTSGLKQGGIMKKIKLSDFKLLRKLIKQGRYEEAIQWAHIIDGHYRPADSGRQLASGGSCDDTDVSYFGIVYYPKGDFAQSYPQCPETLLEAYYDHTTEEFFDVSGRWV